MLSESSSSALDLPSSQWGGGEGRGSIGWQLSSTTLPTVEGGGGLDVCGCESNAIGSGSAAISSVESLGCDGSSDNSDGLTGARISGKVRL